MTVDVSPLPPGAILLHIGPYKTGSTAIQQSLFDQRAALAGHGVHYPGAWRRLFREGHSLMQWAPRGQEVPPPSVWDQFAARIRQRSERVCISTEDFGRLRRPGRARKVVQDLGAERVHVVAVARALHRLLPSHWQERVKSTEKLTYDEWLHQVFEGDDSQRAHRSFWTSHDIARMATQWLEVLPPERFTVVVSDDSDVLLLSRVFERLLDVPEGLLAPTGGANPSLSASAAEVLRRLNRAFAEHGWPDRQYRALVRHGVVSAMQSAGRSEYDVPMPPLPAWVEPLVVERSQARIDAIRSLGLNVVGDPQRLLPPRSDGGPATADDVIPTTVSVKTAAAGVVGALEASLREDLAAQQRRSSRSDARTQPAPDLAQVGGRDIAHELARRVRRRLRPPRPRRRGGQEARGRRGDG